MKLDCSSLEKAVSQLEKSLNFLHSEISSGDSELRRQFRAASIQAFEYTYELAVKLVRRQLRQIVSNPAELDEMDFMVLMRTAAGAGLIREAPPFKVYREKRNLTSHAYDEDDAEEVVSILDDFLKDAWFVLSELKRRNP